MYDNCIIRNPRRTKIQIITLEIFQMCSPADIHRSIHVNTTQCMTSLNKYIGSKKSI